VVDKSSGQPLPGVHVRLLKGDFGNMLGSDVYGSVSDRAGHYSVTSMPAGTYFLLLERAGYVQAQLTGPLPFASLTLKAGDSLTGYKLEMWPRATISGRVLDEFGDPVQGVQVQLQSSSGSNISVTNIFSGGYNATDDRGEFHLITGPGKYFIQATPRNFRPYPTPETRFDGATEPNYAVTFYPSAATKESAAVVEAAAGADVVGIEIRLAQSGRGGPVRSLTVSGLVTGAPEGARPNVVLRYGDTEDRLYSSRSTSTGPDGKFSISGLQPGFYRIYAQYSSGKTALQSQTIDTRLDNADAANLQLVLAPGEDLTGTVEFVGDAASSAPSAKTTVRLAPADNIYLPDILSCEIAKDGSFRISNVPPGRFHAVVDPMPENAYLKSIVVDGAASLDDTLDFSYGAHSSRVKITVGRNGGRLSGRVLDKNGEPIASGMVMVFFAKDLKQLQQSEDMNRVSGAKYEIKSIRPGKYHLIAVDVLQSATSIQSSDEDAMLKKLFDMAEEIEIKEGDRITKDLTAVDKIPDKEPAHAPENR